MSKKDAEIYLRAAAMIETGRQKFSCEAISVACGYGFNKRTTARKSFSAAFDKSDAELGKPGFLKQGWFGDPYINPEVKRHYRVMVLCFAAAMAETGDI